MNFWQGKNVLVTGGAGFIGSHLVELLIGEGAKVTVPVKDLSKTNFLEKVKEEIEIKKADLMKYENCIELTKGKDIVMNLAAKVGGIEYNIAHPGSIFKNNLLMFMNVLEASRINKVDTFMTTSSACVYPRFCTIPTPEEEGFKGTPEPTNEGYGWAKRMEEFLTESYAREYGMKIAIARPYNAYGPRDNFDPKSSHVIPALIKRVLDGENPFVVWGSGNQSRSFLYVTDFARGLMLTVEKGVGKGAINIGTNEETKIKYVVDKIMKLTGKNPEVIYDTTKPEGQPRRNCDNRLAKEILGFEAQVSLEQGLKEAIEWYKKQDH